MTALTLVSTAAAAAPPLSPAGQALRQAQAEAAAAMARVEEASRPCAEHEALIREAEEAARRAAEAAAVDDAKALAVWLATGELTAPSSETAALRQRAAALAGPATAARRVLPGLYARRDAAIAAQAGVVARRDVAHAEAFGDAMLEYLEAEAAPLIKRLREVLALPEGAKAVLFDRANTTLPPASGVACKIGDGINALMRRLVVRPDVTRARGFSERLYRDPASPVVLSD
jgi:hypothetical protein